MVKNFFRGTFTVLGLLAGYIIGESITKNKYIAQNAYFSNIIIQALFLIFMTVAVGVILFLISPAIYRYIKRFISYMESGISKLSASEVIFGVLGAAIGIIIVSIFTSFLGSIPFCLNPHSNVISGIPPHRY